MRSLVVLLAVLSLGGCTVSDMGETVHYHMSDAGLLDHSDTQRAMSLRLQPDSFIFIGQGPFAPPGGDYPPANVVADVAFKEFVEYFPLVRKARAPLGLEAALSEARDAGAHYVLYTRFAKADDRIGDGNCGRRRRLFGSLGILAAGREREWQSGGKRKGAEILILSSNHYGLVDGGNAKSARFSSDRYE